MLYFTNTKGNNLVNILLLVCGLSTDAFGSLVLITIIPWSFEKHLILKVICGLQLGPVLPSGVFRI